MSVSHQKQRIIIFNILLLLFLIQITSLVAQGTFKDQLDGKGSYSKKYPINDYLNEMAKYLFPRNVTSFDSSIVQEKLFIEELGDIVLIEINEELKQLKNHIDLIERKYTPLSTFYINSQTRVDDSFLLDDSMHIQSDYSKCDFCSGRLFHLYSRNDDTQIILQDSNLYTKKGEFWFLGKSDGQLQSIIVETFQRLWNCANPTDQIKITKQFDDETQTKFGLISVDKKLVCKEQCSVQHCSECSSPLVCINCNEGFELYELDCRAKFCEILDSSNCKTFNFYFNKYQLQSNLALNPQKNETGCVQGKYLHNGICLDECPEELNLSVSQRKCILCEDGTYFHGDDCRNCEDTCSKCSKDKCFLCKKGFRLNKSQKKCEVCYDQNICPGQVCESGKFRQLVKPFGCQQCHKNCSTCNGGEAHHCTSCPSKDHTLFGGLCTQETYKPGKFVDSVTGIEKECHFSCSSCEDLSDLCQECHPYFNFFVATKNGKKQCYLQCPQFYEPIKDDDSLLVECKLQGEQALSEEKCDDNQYFNSDENECKKCPSKCISCTSSDICSECQQGYYWDKEKGACLSCDISCSKCTGPANSDCLLCKNLKKMYPKNGKCSNNKQESTDISYSQNLKTIQNVKQNCEDHLSNTSKLLYNLPLKIFYSTQTDDWKDITLFSQGGICEPSNFQQIYSNLKGDEIKNCNSISQSKMQTKGQMTVIYAMLLAYSKVQIDGEDIDPKTLSKFAKEQNKYATSYIYRPRGQFSCSLLSCETYLEGYLTGFKNSNEKTVTIKSTDEIIFTQKNGELLNCIDQSQYELDKDPLLEFEDTAAKSRISINTNFKKFFLVHACVANDNAKVTKKTLLILNVFEKGLIKVLDVDQKESENSQFDLFIQGASKETNQYFKNCNAYSYKNPYESYVIHKIRIVEVEIKDDSEEEDNSDETEEKEKDENSKELICQCEDTKDYILQNEEQGGKLFRFVKNDGTILTKSITTKSIEDLLQKYLKLDANKMKNQGIVLSVKQADRIFDKYLKKVTKKVDDNFQLDKKTNKCLRNILIDAVICNEDLVKEDKKAIQNVVNDLIKFREVLEKSQFCQKKKDRCSRYKQTLRTCKRD